MTHNETEPTIDYDVQTAWLALSPEQKALARQLVDGLCEESWQGRWYPERETNARPLAWVTVVALMRVFESLELSVSPRNPSSNQVAS